MQNQPGIFFILLWDDIVRSFFHLAQDHNGWVLGWCECVVTLERTICNLPQAESRTSWLMDMHAMMDHAGLVHRWESECWGVLGTPLLENRKACRIYQTCISCFSVRRWSHILHFPISCFLADLDRIFKIFKNWQFMFSWRSATVPPGIPGLGCQSWNLWIFRSF